MLFFSGLTPLFSISVRHFYWRRQSTGTNHWQSRLGAQLWKLQTYMQVVSFLSKLRKIYEQKTAKRVCVAKRQECGTGIGSGFNPSN
jgi:hypothetical protein